MPTFYLGKSNRPHNPINSISLAVSNHQAARISRFNRQNMTTGCTSCPCTTAGVDCETTGNWCTGTYADCAGAVCQAIPNTGYYSCNCLVTNGCSKSFNIPCSQVAANGTTVYSTFSPYALIQNNLASVVVNGGFTFAGCLGAECINNGNGTATCTCPGQTTTQNVNVNLWVSSNPTLQQSQIQQIQSGKLIISASYAGNTPPGVYPIVSGACFGL
jgi:hypothetical protein